MINSKQFVTLCESYRTSVYMFRETQNKNYLLQAENDYEKLNLFVAMLSSNMKLTITIKPLHRR